MRILLFFFFMVCLLQVKSQVLVRNTTVVDVENKKLVAGKDVLVQNGIITAVGKKLPAPAGAQVIDGSGKFLMPGLVDAHVHFFQSGGIYTRPDAIDLRKNKPYEEEIRWTRQNMEAQLRRYTRAGITSVIDVGSTVNFLQQRDTFRNKAYAPTVYMTGPLLTTYEPEVFKGLGNDEPFYLMKTPEEARAYVRRQLPYKPDFIKIWYILLGRNKDSAARASLPLVQAAIDEARKNNLRIAVHATERITAQLAVEAGADLLVHGVEDEPIDEAFVSLLKRKGTVISPTMVVAGNYMKTFAQAYQPTPDDYRYAHPTPLASLYNLPAAKDTALVNRYRAYALRNVTASEREDSIRRVNLQRLANGGVIIATGTDAGNIGTQHVSSYYDELAAMQQSGMRGWDLLQASTINGAKAVGKEGEFGAVKKGLRADLLLLSKNPIEDFRNWQSIAVVINRGAVLQPDSLLKPTPEELADQQLLAYNAHNLEAFLEPYAEDVEIYELETNKLQVKGKEAMRKQYSFLNTAKTLYCNLLNRIVQDNIVVDHEEIWGEGGRKFYGLAIYEIKGDKIVRVWFPR
ncbi:MAG TPA: amidohydrolase family protein [Flavisolibacter sp.]|jgi:imidazolonepropionase-like amidohydrolase|nr:amidohydrolase family protein [Flavisolibacter sp.]